MSERSELRQPWKLPEPTPQRVAPLSRPVRRVRNFATALLAAALTLALVCLLAVVGAP